MRVRTATMTLCAAAGVVSLSPAIQPANIGPSRLSDRVFPGGPRPVHIQTVVVGNPGNPGQTHHHETFGRVDDIYEIATYEVTAGQYANFLNAVAATDTHGLYSANMWTHPQGCGIQRTGAQGSYRYSVAPDFAHRPVNFVSWADAVRFANWLHNGQPTGAQDLTTTEDGSYFINGLSEGADHLLDDVIRKPAATWVIPSEDEWYKAAYHKNDGVTGNYNSLPTGPLGNVSNHLIDPDPGNNATFHDHPDDTLGPPYWRTEVGAHEHSESPYGTFDQGGNVQEWTEATAGFDIRRLRGGSFFWGVSLLFSNSLDDVYHSSDQFSDIGFRVARIP